MKAARILAAVAVAAPLALAPTPSGAQQALQVRTDYPSVLVEAGESVTFDVDVVTSSSRRVDLSVAEAPPGWQAVLRGGGFLIGGVFGDPEAPPQVELEVQVPPDATNGDYQIVLSGSSAGASDVLTLNLRVVQEATGAVSLDAEFPEQRGGADETFTFNLTLENNTPDETTFNLAAQGPRGWSVSATPATETRAATVNVQGGGTAEITVNADPPDDTTADTYPIRVQATGAGGKAAEAELSVEITGNVQMALTTADERLNREGSAGDATEITVEVRNTGTAPLRSVSLSATPPTGWDVTFSPETVDVVEPGETAQVTAVVTPAGEAVAGDYSIAFSASAAEGGSGSFDLRFTVNTSRFWLIVGLLLIVGALVALRWVFRRYGRR